MSKPSSAELAAASRFRGELRKPAAIAAVEHGQRRQDEIAKTLRLLDVPKVYRPIRDMLKQFDFKPSGLDLAKITGIRPVTAGIDFSTIAGVQSLQVGGSALVEENAALRKLVERSAVSVHTSGVAARLAEITDFRKSLQGDIGAESLALKMLRDRTTVSESINSAHASLRAQRQALAQTRAALSSFDTAALGLRAYLRLAPTHSAGAFGAYTAGLATSDVLSAYIRVAAVQLARSGGPWAGLPQRSIAGLAGLSTLSPLAASLPDDLMGIARGVYGLTAFAARAASMSGPQPITEVGPDETVEEWSDSSLAEEVRTALAELHPALAAKLDGAWDVYRRRGPDALGQAATSLVELIDRSMDLLAPRAALLEFAADKRLTGERYFTRDDNPTVALKVRFVLRERPLTANALEQQVRALTSARRKLQGSKHSLDFADDLLIGRLLITVENVFTVILLG